MIRKCLQVFTIVLILNNTCNGQKLLSIDYQCEIFVDFDTLQGSMNHRKTFENSLNKSKLLAYSLQVDDNEKKSIFSLKKVSDPSVNKFDLLMIEQMTDLKGKFVLSNNIMAHNYEILGKEFNVLISKKVKWALTKNTKIVNGYKCYKATGVIQYGKNKGKALEAWYTDEIPLPYGPKVYNGLPGLILEIKEENYVLKASNIVFVNKIKINIPNKANLISEKQADSILSIMEENAKGYFQN